MKQSSQFKLFRFVLMTFFVAVFVIGINISGYFTAKSDCEETITYFAYCDNPICIGIVPDRGCYVNPYTTPPCQCSTFFID